MWLNFKGKKRQCFFCSKFHGGECPVEKMVRQLEKDRDEIQKQLGHMPSKTYTDSTMRYASQKAFASDIDVMSGGSIGNIINAIEVDEQNTEVPSVIIIGGSGDVHRPVQPAEFLWGLQKNTERLKKLATKKKSISILPPPTKDSPSEEDIAKQRLFKEALADLATKTENITVWENPLKRYDEDQGSHPSPEQTEQLLRYIDAMVAQQNGSTYLLKSASSETITTTKKYSRVNSLYKFGCTACSSRKKNKWYYVCIDCKTTMSNDEDNKLATENFNNFVSETMEANNPALPSTTKGMDVVSEDGVRARSPLGKDGSNPSDRNISTTSLFSVTRFLNN